MEPRGQVDACAAGILLYSAVKGGIGEVDVFLAQTLFGQAQTFTEVINLSNGHSALEPQGI